MGLVFYNAGMAVERIYTITTTCMIYSHVVCVGVCLSLRTCVWTKDSALIKGVL